MIISKTPLRISLFGGGSDFPEYFKTKNALIIGGTINKYIYITLSDFYSKLFKEKIRLFYKKREFVNSNKKIKHKVIRKVLEDNKINQNIELHIISDLPGNTGLGSSSSFSTGLLNVVNFYKKKDISKKDLSLKTIKLERDKLRENVGYQDQIFASYGGFSKIVIKDRNKFKVSRYKNTSYIKKIEKNLFLIFTGIKRKADLIEKKKIKNIKKNFKYLDAIQKIAKLADNNINKKKNINFVGDLLHKTWSLKKKLDKNVSNKKIETIYKKGLSNGATGGKLLGAGAGGFILFYVPLKKHKKFLEKFRKSSIDFKFTLEGSRVIGFN
jgi:D-glycero-alpha-D-manno-heptose-7-phosphate kinase